MIFALFFSMIGCGEHVNRYRCTCEVTAYEMEDLEDVEISFSEVICETEEGMEDAFGPNGSLRNAKEQCEADYKNETDDYACDCTCVYLDPC